MNFRIDLAGNNDDGAIRQLLASNAVPGRIAVTYEREPDYFRGCATMGSECQVLVARAGDNGSRRLAGVACRAVRSVFINGREEKLGYLGQLRVDADFRGRWLVSHGFSFLKRLHDDDPVPAYLVSLVEGNHEAAGVLINRRRKHFPAFHEIGGLFTLALMVGKLKPSLPSKAAISRASDSDLGEIISFLRQSGARRQFYPAWAEADFRSDGATPGFQIEDFFIARRDGELVGAVGLWDQSAYKQTVVRGYGGWMRAARPFYNAVAPLFDRPRLPAPGRKIRHAYAAFVCVADDDADTFRALLREVYSLAASRGHDYLLIGLEARDPLLTVAREYSHIAYPSRLYLASWDDGKEFYERLDRRVAHVEIATL
ncbi:MAG TPA: hypothetical protein VFD58_19520 [Blastocatellia bacterium]|nr:hypothetical protein [Blastocatellia bacterium]